MHHHHLAPWPYTPYFYPTPTTIDYDAYPLCWLCPWPSPHRRPCKWCRLWLRWLPHFVRPFPVPAPFPVPPLPLVKPLPLTNPRHPQANAPFFPEIASRYRRVHRHFNRAHRRHPLRVADDISEIADYMVALRHVQPWCGRGAVGMLVWEMEGLVGGLVDKAG